MQLVKINEYKYQVLKVGEKNSVTLPFEGQKRIAIYTSTEDTSKNYVNIDSVKAEVRQYVDVDVAGHDDYLLALDLYIDDNGNCSTHKFDMQATKQDLIDSSESVDIKEISVDEVLERLKVSEEEKIKALELQLRVTSIKQEKEQVDNYREYLKSGELKRKLMVKMKGKIPSLNDNLMTKYNAIICFLPEVEALLTNTEISQPEKELIVDYILVSRYKILKFEKLFLKEKAVKANDNELVIKFVSNAKKLLLILEANPSKITNCLEFIASSLNAISKMTKNEYFDREIVSYCNTQTIDFIEKVNGMIASDFDIIGNIVKGEK